MKKFSSLVVLSALVLAPLAAHAEDAAPAAAVKGKMLYAAGGQRIGAIYKVDSDGSAEVILDGRMVTIPGATISTADGKIATTLSKNELISMH